MYFQIRLPISHS